MTKGAGEKIAAHIKQQEMQQEAIWAARLLDSVK